MYLTQLVAVSQGLRSLTRKVPELRARAVCPANWLGGVGPTVANRGVWQNYHNCVQ